MAGPKWIPAPDQIKAACKDVAWEYAAMLGAALEMAKGPEGPTNHFVQEAFLVHVRNLGEFFRKGVKEFRQDPSQPPLRDEDNIFAVDFCSTVLWDETPFNRDRKLPTAINKTLSHMTYSRKPGSLSDPFDGYRHAHGTVILLRRTWSNFMASMQPSLRECPESIEVWLGKHTNPNDKFGLRVDLVQFEHQFERLVSQRSEWLRNQTPDGPA
jgi:hypothetical protein